MMNEYKTIRATLFSSATSLNFFAVLNILKEAYPAVKNFLNFYDPVGPLLGLYLMSILVLAALFVFGKLLFTPKNNANALAWYFVLSAVLFLFLTFPPLFEPIVDFLK